MQSKKQETDVGTYFFPFEGCVRDTSGRPEPRATATVTLDFHWHLTSCHVANTGTFTADTDFLNVIDLTEKRRQITFLIRPVLLGIGSIRWWEKGPQASRGSLYEKETDPQ